MFYAGVPLALFALTLPRLDRLLRRAGARRRVTVLAGPVAAAIFVLSGLLLARAVHDPERAERERTRAADSDAIRGLVEGKTVAAAIVTSLGDHYYFRGAVQTEFAKRHLADFVLGERLAGVRSLTPDNRSWFLYDRSVYEAALNRYERRADAQRPILQSPHYDVHFIRNEGGGNELLYFRRECPAAMDLGPRFFLHVRPFDANDLHADRRRHGFENRDFSHLRFWRRDGKCYAVRPLPDYGIASIHTGQFRSYRTREGVRDEHVWAGSFSPGDLDGAGGGAPPR